MTGKTCCLIPEKELFKTWRVVDEVLGSTLRISRKNGRDMLLILNFPLFDSQKNPVKYLRLNDSIELRYLREFAQTIVPDERYFLYLFQKVPR